LLGNGSANTSAEANARNNRREVFSVVRAARVANRLCGKQISAALNQHATTGEAVFTVGAAPRLYNEDLRQLELELSRVPDLEVASENDRVGSQR
jgi:hypothetical protein